VSGGGGTGATTRYYQKIELNKFEDSIDEEEEESEVVDEDKPLQINTNYLKSSMLQDS